MECPLQRGIYVKKMAANSLCRNNFFSIQYFIVYFIQQCAINILIPWTIF